MIFIKTQRKNWGSLWAVIAFLVMAIIMVYPLAMTGRISANVDWLFHASRVEQIYDNLKQGVKFTFISTNTFQRTGVGSFLFYPDGSLYIWALLRFIFSPITAYYVWVGIFIFLTFTVGYFCMLNFSDDKLRSFIFALLYGLAPYHLYLSPVNWVIGEFTAYTFIPIVFLGIYKVLKGNEKQWPLLAVGFALLLLSHLLSVVLCAEILVVFLVVHIVRVRRIEISRLISLIKSGITAAILACPILFLFLTEYVHKGIAGPYSGVYLAQNLNTLFSDSMNNLATWSSIGLILLVIALTGWKWIKRDNEEISIYVMMIILLLISTTIFPWKSFNKTPLAVVQLPCRYLTYAILFGAILGSRWFAESIRKLKSHKALVIALVIPVMLLGYFGSISPLTDNLNSYTPNFLCRLANGQHQVLSNRILTNKNYNDQFAYWAYTGEIDYYPVKTNTLNMKPGTSTWDAITKNPKVNSIINDIVIVNGQAHRYKLSTTPNQFHYQIDLKKSSTVDFPVIKYAGTDAFVNGKKVALSLSQRGTVQLRLDKGTNNVMIGFSPSKFYYVSIAIMVLGWLGIIIFYVRKLI